MGLKACGLQIRNTQYAMRNAPKSLLRKCVIQIFGWVTHFSIRCANRRSQDCTLRPGPPVAHATTRTRGSSPRARAPYSNYNFENSYSCHTYINNTCHKAVYPFLVLDPPNASSVSTTCSHISQPRVNHIYVSS